MKSLRKRAFNLINIGYKDDLASRICDYIIVAAIVLNLSILIADTFTLPECIVPTLRTVEYCTLVIFIVEYVCRVWTAPELFPNKPEGKAYCSFIFSFYGLIDLLSILPYLLPLFLPTGLVALRVLRIFRIFRLFRINTQYDAFNVVIDVLWEKKNQLLSSVALISICMLAASLLMYSLEHNAQPEAFANAFSGLWWAVSAIFTVGYGDITPQTPLGQVLAIIISFLGVGLVAIPTGIISAGFVEQYSKMKSITDASGDLPLDFISISLEETHPWLESTIADIEFPPEFIVVAVKRDKEVIIPKGDTMLYMGDVLILCAMEWVGDVDLRVREVFISDNHLWRDKLVKDIGLPQRAIVASVLRDSRPVAVSGDLKILLHDKIILCEKQDV
ncbi:MAG: ion transporter [Eubacterium sp.]|nr:ion transporter [Eubacterium sp.]